MYRCFHSSHMVTACIIILWLYRKQLFTDFYFLFKYVNNWRKSCRLWRRSALLSNFIVNFVTSLHGFSDLPVPVVWLPLFTLAFPFFVLPFVLKAHEPVYLFLIYCFVILRFKMFPLLFYACRREKEEERERESER